MLEEGIFDIHCHIVPGVDDGAADIEETRKLLEMEYKQGVRNIILTPHFRFQMFETPLEKVQRQFRLAEEAADEEVKAAIEELVEKLDGKDFVTGFDEFKVLDADKAEKNADGKYEVEIAVPSITDTMENIQLVAYSKEDAKKWQIVDPISVDKENKTLEVALDDGAFFTVVADAE